MKLQIKKLLLALSIGFIGLGSGSAMAEPGHDAHHQNAVGIYLGSTVVEGDDAEFTFGVEYEHLFTKYVGLGPIIEHTPYAHHGDGATVALGAFHLHPIGDLRLTVAAGSEWVHGDHPHDAFLWRLGATYEFLFDSFSVAPTFNVDFIGNKKAFVVGTVFSYHF